MISPAKRTIAGSQYRKLIIFIYLFIYFYVPFRKKCGKTFYIIIINQIYIQNTDIIYNNYYNNNIIIIVIDSDSSFNVTSITVFIYSKFGYLDISFNYCQPITV